MLRTLSKPSILALSIAAASQAYAAPVTKTIGGDLSNWRSWGPYSSITYVPNYSVASNGIDLFHGANHGDVRSTAGPSGTYQSILNISVIGSITYDDQTGVITALSLTQQSSVKGYYDINNNGVIDDNTTWGDPSQDDELEFSNLSWELNGTNLLQKTGMATGCFTSSAFCNFTKEDVNTNSGTNASGQSVFDFRGITRFTAGSNGDGGTKFAVNPRGNSTQTAYGTSAFTKFAAANGISNLFVNLVTGDVELNVVSQVDAGSPVLNNVNMAQFNLQVAGLFPVSEVPVPAAAWLMGSGLIGLAGIARRKK